MSKSKPRRDGFRITELHAIIGIGEDNEEGIPAIHIMDGAVAMPLIASDGVRLELLVKSAQMIADQTGQTFKVAKFSVREDVGVIKSKKLS
jgi:hypothetical protein